MNRDTMLRRRLMLTHPEVVEAAFAHLDKLTRRADRLHERQSKPAPSIENGEARSAPTERSEGGRQE